MLAAVTRGMPCCSEQCWLCQPWQSKYATALADCPPHDHMNTIQQQGSAFVHDDTSKSQCNKLKLGDQISYRSGDSSSSAPSELVKLAKDPMPRRPRRPPQPFLGDPCGDEALEVSDSSDSSPEAARCLRDIWVSCRKATAYAATKRQLLPVAVREMMRCTTC